MSRNPEPHDDPRHGNGPDAANMGIKQELHGLKSQVGILAQKLSVYDMVREQGHIAPSISPPVFTKPIELPQWADARSIEGGVGLRVARLHQWVRSGWVRKAKLGETRQAGALYCVEDVRDALQRIAGGMAPRKKRPAT